MATKNSNTKLYQIQHDTNGKLYCGPAAICAVTGEPSSVVLAAVRKLREQAGSGSRNGRVVAMYSSEVARTLRALGFDHKLELHSRGTRKTLTQWLRSRTAEQRKIPHIVLVTGHFVVVLGNRLVDSIKRDPVWLSDCGYQRRRVVSTIAVGSAA